MNVGELLRDRRICVCVGPGGVGKTTAAAAIALGLAAEGRRVAVVTIDPARRLADALGLDALDNEPSQVDPERIRAAGLPLHGELWAMMLDPKRTFDELIDRAASSPEKAAAVKTNRIYRQLSSAVAGSQEFTAVAKLDELAQDWEFDAIVLDTPPARNALDFLDAPARITGFLEGRALKTFLRPTGLGMRVLGLGAAPLLAGLRRITGIDLVSELMTFFSLIGGMTGSFEARARRVEALLRAPDTAFLLVTSAEPEAAEEALWFAETLASAGLPAAGTIVNRFQSDPQPAAELEPLDSSLGGALAAKVAAAFSDYRVLARRDAANVERLRTGIGERPLLLVPQFDGDVHDLEGLLRLREHIFGPHAGAA